MIDTNILEELFHLIKERQIVNVDDSYTNYLFEKGIDKVLKKIGEESSEIIIGAKNNSNEEVIYEICDFIYHLLVLMAMKGIEFKDIENELKKRRNKGR